MKSLHPFTIAASIASPSKKRAKLPIMIYHRVLERFDPLLPGVPDTLRFGWQAKMLAEHFRVLPLHEAVERLQSGTLPARAAAITFDDGYADNYTCALPILQGLGLPATFFVATAYLDGGRMFNDTVIELVRRLPDESCDFTAIGLGMQKCATVPERRALIKTLIEHFKYRPSNERREAVEKLASRFRVTLPTDLMLDVDQLRALGRTNGVEIGAHTHTHPILTCLSPEEAYEDITIGRQTLESHLDTPVRLFAYPNGRPRKDYNADHVEMVKRCGFDFAVSTVPAPARFGCDPYELPRFTPWDPTPGRFALRVLHTLWTK